jgi:hypothetical protein
MEKTLFEQASPEVKKQIKDEYNKWYAELTGKNIQEVLKKLEM